LHRSIRTPLFLLTLLGLFAPSVSAQSGCGAPDPFRIGSLTLEGLLDQGLTSTTQTWNDDAGEWRNVSRTTYQREEPRSGTRLFARWVPETQSWPDYLLDASFAFDADRRLVETRYMNTEGEAYQRDVVTYGADGYPSLEAREDRAGTGWVGNRRYFYDYTADGQLAGYRFERNQDGWTFSLEYEGSFDAAGRRVLCAFRSDSEGPFTRRVETAYDDQDRPVSLVERSWDADAETYVQVGDSVGFAYAEAGLAIQTAYHYVAYLDAWRPERRSVSSYDEAGRLAEVLEEVDAGPDPDRPSERRFAPTRRLRLGYHGDGRVASYTLERYDDGWQNDRRYLYEYAYGTASEPTAPSASSFALAVSPNPSSGAIVARLSADASAEARVVVFDALGRQVRVAHEGPVAAGELALPIDLSGLPAGVYVVRATVGDAVVSRAVTVAR
jgi:hypothetical protein